MLKEIGSEFWLSFELTSTLGKFNPNDFLFKGDIKYVLSGRTAIDSILQDIESDKDIHNVYLSAYCCDSMVYPIINRNINVIFYDVKLDAIPAGIDILYLTNYFGYQNDFNIELIQDFKRRGGIVLYDRTHSLMLQDDSIVDLADYSFSSFRKWCNIPLGAIVCKRTGLFKNIQLNDYPYIKERVSAMQQKGCFIGGDDTIEKQEFLELFSCFAHHLTSDYRNYKMDEYSLQMLNVFDFGQMRALRDENAEILCDELNDISEIEFYKKQDNLCHLFLPILCKSKQDRDALRKYLISKQIYCPIHWPKGDWVTEQYPNANNIIDRELSLICDQRYGVEEMGKIASEIKSYYN